MTNKALISVLIALLFGGSATTSTPEPVTKQVTKEVVEEVVEEVVVQEVLTPEPTLVCLGKFKASAYCKENYPHICNNGDSSTTATGTTPTAGRTIAVDPSVIPYGTQVVINGHTYIAEDCGGGIKGNRVDILFATHREALNFGIQYVEVFVVKENS